MNSLPVYMIVKKKGVRYFRFHPLRHAGASIMDRQNVSIGVIQRIQGHENRRRTTEIYLHSVGGWNAMPWPSVSVQEKSLTRFLT